MRVSFSAKFPEDQVASTVILTPGFRPTASPSPSSFMGGIRGFVASYSSATVAEFHGIPCADASNTHYFLQLMKSLDSR